MLPPSAVTDGVAGLWSRHLETACEVELGADEKEDVHCWSSVTIRLGYVL